MTELSEYQHYEHIQSKLERAKEVIAELQKQEFNRRLQDALQSWVDYSNIRECPSNEE